MSDRKLPPLVLAPPSSIRERIPSEDWVACLDAWIVSIETRLQLSEEDFETLAPKDAQIKPFLLSYFPYAVTSSTESNARTLRRLCFLLARRLLLASGAVSDSFLDWRFLGSFCSTYSRSAALKSLLRTVWQRSPQGFTLSIEKGKSQLMLHLRRDSSVTGTDVLVDLQQLSLLAFALPEAGYVLMTGSDYIDSMFEAYQNQKNKNIQSAIVANIYVALSSLMTMIPPAISLLLDQLFNLKSAAAVDVKNTKNEPDLLSDLICSTNLLKRMERLFSTNPQKRADGLIASLRSYRSLCQELHPHRRHPRKRNKGKQRAVEVADTVMAHTHKMSLVTQIQDLFPDLGFEYVVKLLDHYGDDAETVISHLLEGTLPTQPETLGYANEPDIRETASNNAPDHLTPPLSLARNNVFDDDEFDRLAISPSRVHFGRTNADLTADDILADRSSHMVNKAAIMSALAAFDSDDDEHDDTYDIADVGGTVDTMPPGTEAETNTEAAQRARGGIDARIESMLFNLYKSSPDLFKRDATTRRSNSRVSLRKDTGMTDESIEGWAVMLSRDSKRMARREHDHVLSAGLSNYAQPVLQAGSSHEHLAHSGDEENAAGRAGGKPTGSSDFGGPRGDGMTRGRGRGRGRGQRGGSNMRGDMNADAVGSSQDHDAARSKRIKDAKKASRANHNRRDQRAKKMARGGL